jgi:hypothetical protein
VRSLSHEFIARQLKLRKPRKDTGECHLAFQAGKRCAHTLVDGATERQVLMHWPIDTKNMRFIEHGRIAIAGLKRGRHRHATCWWTAQHFMVIDHFAARENNWRIVAQYFFDRSARKRRFSAELCVSNSVSAYVFEDKAFILPPILHLRRLRILRVFRFSGGAHWIQPEA